MPVECSIRRNECEIRTAATSKHHRSGVFWTRCLTISATRQSTFTGSPAPGPRNSLQQRGDADDITPTLHPRCTTDTLQGEDGTASICPHYIQTLTVGIYNGQPPALSPTFLPSHPPTYPPTHLPTLPPTFLPSHPPSYPPTHLSTPTLTPTHPPMTLLLPTPLARWALIN